MKSIDEVDITGKRVLLRVDFNVSLNDRGEIIDDERMCQTLPTIEYLGERHNKLILVSHLDHPKGRDPKLSLKSIAKHLQKLLPSYTIHLVNDFLTDTKNFTNQTENDILLLENIRFYPQEQDNDTAFAKELAKLADVFVNDAFGVSHRKEASVVSVPQFLPSYGGFLIKKEVEVLSHALTSPEHPVVAIIGGSKISTKINLLDRLLSVADTVLIGGGLANTFFSSQGIEIGKSICEKDEKETAQRLLEKAKSSHAKLLLPIDVVIKNTETNHSRVAYVAKVESLDTILDIGIETVTTFSEVIRTAKTIIWNGPMGYFEDPAFRRGTDGICEAIIRNKKALSIVGGGDTIAAIGDRPDKNTITHISTGGGAMLSFIEHGSLPGIEALEKSRV